MSDQSQQPTQGGGSTYGYDPFANRTQGRWGRRDGAKDPAPEIPGYEMRDRIGSGGMGTVWSARFVALNQSRAVKVLDRSLSRDPEFQERFRQEAQALGRLEHPNIVRVFDANPDHDPPYLAMDWVEGKSLTDAMGGRPMPPKAALPIFEGIAAALDHAHGAGFIHRDLKPSNVMISNRGAPMLIDFGVASWLGADVGGAQSLTGTTRYLSPEVIQGRPVSSSSDLWALAVLMYRVLTGRMPFDGPTADAILADVVKKDPEPPQGVSPRVARFLVKALEKDPRKRYRSAGEMVADLRRAVDPIPVKLGGDRPKLLLLGAGGLAALAALGFIAFRVAKPNTVVKERVVVQKTPAVAPSPKGGDKPATGVDAAARALAGNWFADLGDAFAEVSLEPGPGGTVRATWRNRSSAGAEEPVEATGTLAAGRLTLAAKDPAGNPLLSFGGQAAPDGTRITGLAERPGASSQEATLVRADGVALTPYRSESGGFELQIPTSWTSSEAANGDARTVTFHPVGDDRVFLAVTVSPEPDNRALTDLVALRASSIPGSQTVTSNPDASEGGRKGAAYELRWEPAPTRPSRLTGFLTYRGGQTVAVESGLPVADEATWGGLLQRIRATLRVGD